MADEIFKIRLECTSGSSNKFYTLRIERHGNGLLAEVSYGPIGRPQSTYNFASWQAGDAQVICSRATGFASKINTQIKGKIKKGYVPTELSGNDPSEPREDFFKLPGDIVGESPRPSKAVQRNARSLSAWLDADVVKADLAGVSL